MQTSSLPSGHFSNLPQVSTGHTGVCACASDTMRGEVDFRVDPLSRPESASVSLSFFSHKSCLLVWQLQWSQTSEWRKDYGQFSLSFLKAHRWFSDSLILQMNWLLSMAEHPPKHGWLFPEADSPKQCFSM